MRMCMYMYACELHKRLHNDVKCFEIMKCVWVWLDF
jgi:hypothetical protein